VVTGCLLSVALILFLEKLHMTYNDGFKLANLVTPCIRLGGGVVTGCLLSVALILFLEKLHMTYNDGFKLSNIVTP